LQLKENKKIIKKGKLEEKKEGKLGKKKEEEIKEIENSI